MDFVVDNLNSPLVFNGETGVDTISFSSFTSALSFNLSGTVGGLLQIQVSDGSNFTTIETTSIERIIGGSGNDTFVLNGFGDSSTPFLGVDDLIRLEGGTGADAILVSGDVHLGDASLFLASESITVASSATISTTDNVVLNAIAASNFAGDTAPLNPLNLIAGIAVEGAITASAVKLNALVSNTLALSDSSASFAVDSVSSATAIVSATASITASTLEVTADTATNLAVEVTGATVDSIRLGSETTPITQTTHAAIAGGAQISVESAAISAEESASILVQATDATTIQTTLSTDTSSITQFTGFDAVFSSTYLSRDTKAYVGDENAQAIINGGDADTAAGILKVSAENRNGANGEGIVSDISSNFLGVHTTEVSKDDAIAYIENADITAEHLEVTAANRSTYSATAKAALNSAIGNTKAYITSSNISTSSVVGAQSVILSAVDQSAFIAHSDELPDSDADYSSLDVLDITTVFALNKIQKDTQAYITNSNIESAEGRVSVEATSDLAVTAAGDTLSITNGGFFNLDSLGFAGTLVVNEVVGDVSASIKDSTVTANGDDADVVVAATNTSEIDAIAKAGAVSNGGSGATVGANIAVNLIGASADNILESTIDTLLGIPLDSAEGSANTQAFIKNSDVLTNGGVTVSAESAQQINASVSNISDSSASGIIDAGGAAVGAILSSNRIVGQTLAFVSADDDSTRKKVTAANGLDVNAIAAAAIDSTVKLSATSETSTTLPTSNNNSIGVAATFSINEAIGGTKAYVANIDVDASAGNVSVSASTASELIAALSSEVSSSGGSKFGEGTSLGLNGMVATNVVSGETEARVEKSDIVASGDVKIGASNTSSVDATVKNATTSGDAAIGVTVAFNSVGYESENILSNSVDALLGKSVLGADEASGATAFISDTTVDTDGLVEVTATAASSMTSSVTNKTESSASALTGATGISVGTVVASNKAASAAEAYIKSTEEQGRISGDLGISVSATDGSSIDATVSLTAASETSNTNSFSNSDSIGVAAAVVMNDVKGGAKSRIDNVDVDASAGDVAVSANTTSTLKADLSSEASSSGGSQLGAGTSVAVNGMVATNVSRGETESKVEDSDVTAGGDVGVTASNTSSVDATVKNATTSGDKAIGVTVAFNSVGYESEDILSNSVDVLLGKSVLGTDESSGATAFISDTTVDADGSVDVSATAASSMKSSVTNKTESSASALTGATGLSVGTVVVSNKAVSAAEAYIENTEEQGSVSGDGGVSVSATDGSSIDATVSLTAASETSNTNSFSNSDSIGVAAAVVMNDVKGGAKSRIDNVDVDASAGDVAVSANTTSTLKADLSSEASSSGGSQLGAGTSVAVNGMVATNVSRGETESKVEDSDVTAGGDVSVTASNTSSVDATVKNATTSGDKAIGVTVAFNSVGYESEDILSNSVDALLGKSVLGTDESSGATAFISDTTVDADGSVGVSATAASSMTSSVTNKTESSASALTGATGLSVGTVVASNKASSAAEAYIESSDGSPTLSVSGDDGVSVSAIDDSSVDSIVSLTAASETSNTNWFSNSDSIGVAAAVVMNDVKGGAKSRIDNVDVDASAGDVDVSASTTSELTADLSSEASSSGGSQLGAGTSVAVNGMVATNVARGETEAKVEDSDVTAGGDVTVKASNTSSVDATVENATTSGDKAIGVTVAFNSVGYESEDILSNSVDVLLGKSVLGTDESSGATAFISDTMVDASGSVDVSATAASSMKSSVTNKTESSASALTGATGLSVGTVLVSNKAASAANAYVENTEEQGRVSGGNGVSIRATDGSSVDATVSLVAASETSNTNPFSNSDSIGVAAAVVMNDVKGGAKANASSVDITATGGNVLIQSDAEATLTASLAVEASSSGGSKFGKGTSLAVGGLIATNVLQGGAEAGATDTIIDTSAEGGSEGDVTIAATNISTLTAKTDNAVTSGDTAVGVTLAFNSIGHDAQNVLFNTVDALIGDPAIADAFDSEGGADAKAFMLDSSANAAGKLTVQATAATELDSTVTNKTESAAGALSGASGAAVGAVIATNRVNSAADSSIDYSDTFAGEKRVSTGRGVSVSADDNASINANIQLSTSSVTENTNPFSDSDSYGVSGLVSLNEVKGGAAATVNEATITAVSGDVTVSAIEDADLNAVVDSVTKSDGGSKFGDGESLAASGVVATNLVNSSAIANLTDSNVTTQDTATDSGKTSVEAKNTSKIDANIKNSVESSATTVGVTLAYNTVGYDSQNVLFNTVDALLGTEIGDSQPVDVQASVKGSDVQSAGALSVSATSEVTIDAHIETSATTVDVGGVGDSDTVSVGGNITMNKVAVQTTAAISDDSEITVQDGALSVRASDTSTIDSNVEAPVLSASLGDNSTAVAVGLSTARNLIDSDVEASIKSLASSDKNSISAANGGVIVEATQASDIKSTAAASAIGVSGGASSSKAFSGGGAISSNTIAGSTEAYLQRSDVVDSNSVSLSADDTSTIEATVESAAVAVAIAGGGTAPAVAIGISVASNEIGSEDSDKRVDVKAYTEESNIETAGTLSVTAVADSSISATVKATTVAVGASSGSSVGVSGAGVVTRNQIATNVVAHIDTADQIETGGDVTVSAADSSSAIADSQAVSVGASLAGSNSTSLSIGISTAHNRISNFISAKIKNVGRLLTGGNDVEVTAAESTRIDAESVAAAVSVGMGGSNGIALSGGGAESTNVILSNTEATIEESLLGSQEDKVGDVTLASESTSEIEAEVGAVAVSVAFGGTTGVGVALGASIARNLIGYNLDGDMTESGVQAKLVNTSLHADGELSQEAISNQTIDAEVLAGSVALSGGGTTGVALAGAGVSATNKIGTTVNAQIDGDGIEGIEAASVSLRADDSSTISSDAGAASLAGSVGGTSGVAAAVGVSLSKNEIGNKVTASIDNADSGVTTTTGDITLTAIENAAITARAAAASASVAAGGTAGIALSGAGADATNLISTKTSASASDSVLESADEVVLNANDTSVIDATIVAASAAAAGGGAAGVGASIGAAVARNLIGYDADGNKVASGVEAKLTNTSVQAEGALSQEATASQTVDAKVLAGSVALSGGGVAGVSLSGAGVSATNKIGTTVNAQIDGDGTAGIEAASVSLQATDSSTIESAAGAASLAGSVGGTAGVSASIGISLAKNEIDNEITASIDNADSGVTTTDGDITLSADETANIMATAAAASASAAVGGIAGVALSGAGADATNLIATKTAASISDSRLDSADDVTLTADDNSTIDATIVAASAAAAVGGTAGVGAAIGAAVARNEIGGSIEATVSNVDLKADGDLTQTANSDRTIDAEVLAGSVAIAGGTVGVAASGAGSIVKNKTTTTVNSTIDSTDVAQISQIQADSVALKATDTSTIIANTEASSIAASFGAAGASVSIGSAIAENEIANTIEASITGNTSLTTDNAVTLQAQDDVVIKARSEGISAALAVGISGAAAVGTSSTTNKNNSSVSATIGELDDDNDVTIDAGSVDVQAIGTATLESVDIASALAGSVIAVSVGGGFATNESNQKITALIGDGSEVTSENGVNVQAADATAMTASVGTDAGAAGLVGASVGLSQAENTVTNSVQAAITGAMVDAGAGDVVVEATATVSSDAQAKTTSVAAAIGSAVGGAAAVNNINSVVDAHVSDTTMAADNVAIVAEQTATVAASTRQTSAAVGSVSGTAVSANTFGSSVSAYSQSSNIDADGSILIDADSKTTIEKNEAIGSSAGFTTAIAGSVGINQVSNNVTAAVEGGNLSADGSAAILANATTDVEAQGGTQSAGLVGAGGTVVTNTIDNNTRALIGGNAFVNANADPAAALSVPTKDGSKTLSGLAVIATSDENLEVDIATGAAGGFGLAAAIAVNSLTSTTQAEIKDSAVNQSQSDAKSEQDLFVQAFSDSDVDVNAGSAALGLAGGVGASIDITSVQTVTSATIDNVSDTGFSSGSASVLDSMVIEADANRSVRSNVAAGAAGLGLGASGAISIVTVSSGMSSDAREAADDTQSVVSDQLDQLNSDGIISARQGFLTSTFSSSPESGTTAAASGILNAAEDMSIVANETTNIDIDSGAGSFGLVSVGGGVAIANVEQNANARIGADSTVAVGREITVQATGTVNANQVEASAGSAGLVGLGAAVVQANSENNVSASIGDRTNVNQSDDINITAHSTSNIGADAKGAAVGLAAAGIVIADATEAGTTRAFVGDNVTVRSADNLSVIAEANESVLATSQASSGGLAAAQGSLPTAEVKATVEAAIGDNSAIAVTGDVDVISDVVVDGDANAKGVSIGALAVGASVSEVDATTTIRTSVGDSTSITAGNVTIQSRLGEPTEKVDTSFDAASGNTVNLNSDSITFETDHDLDTGDQVTYFSGGTQTIGGLTNQDSYRVIAVDNKTVKLGAEFDAASRVSAEFNTIQFNSGHGFTTGQQVVYEANGDLVGGLTAGSRYYVEVIDATTIKLRTAAPSNGESRYEFTGSGAKIQDIDNSGQSSTIDIEDHGFQNGNILNYEKRTAQFNITDEIPSNVGDEGTILNLYGDLDSSNRIRSSKHSFENNDKVVYSTDGDAMGGLSNNNTYYIVDRDDDSFKLSETQGGDAIDLAVSEDLLGSSHELTAVGLKVQSVTKTDFSYDDGENSNTINISAHGWNSGQAVVYKGDTVSGLTNNQTYYVIRTSENAIKLASSVTNAGAGTAIDIGSGSGQLQVTSQATDLEEGVPYYVIERTADSFQLATSANGDALILSTSGLTGSGANHIFFKDNAIDLTSTGAGTHNFHLDLSSLGSGRQKLDTGAVASAPSQGDGVFSAYSQASSGGLIGANATQVITTIRSDIRTEVGSNASITATGDVAIDGISTLEVTGGTDSTSVGAIAVGASELNLTVFNENHTTIGSNAVINALGDVVISGETNQQVGVSGSGAAGALLTFADVDVTVNSGHNTTTTIGTGAQITATENAQIQSLSDINTRAKTAADGVGFYADADANTHVKFDGSNAVNVLGDASIEARELVLNSTVTNFTVESRAESEGAGLIGNIDAHAKTDLTGTDTQVNVGAGASLKADFLDLIATFRELNSTAIALADCDGLGGDTDSEATNIVPVSARVFTDSQSKVTIYEMDVQSDIVNENLVTIADSDKAWELRFWIPFVGTVVITMDFGSSDASSQYNTQKTTNFNSHVDRLSREINPILIIGDNGSVQQKSDNIDIISTADSIEVLDIINDETGSIDFIGVANSGSYTSSEIDPAFDSVVIQNYSDKDLIVNAIQSIRAASGIQTNPTIITIENIGNSASAGNPDLVLKGEISNPHDRTIIYSAGNITAEGNQSIVTKDLSLTANDSIGSTLQRVAAELTRGYSPVSGAVSNSDIALSVESQDSLFLDVSTNILDGDDSEIDIASLKAMSGEIDLKLGATTHASGAAVASQYEFSEVVAGTALKIDAGAAEIDIEADTDLSGTGSLDVVTGGKIQITEQGGGINLKRAVSSNSSVTLVLTDTGSDGDDLTLVDGAQVNAAQDVFLLAGDDIQSASTSRITAGGTVFVQGDAASEDSAGTQINLQGVIQSSDTFVAGGDENDTITVKNIKGDINIQGLDGDDSIEIEVPASVTQGVERPELSLIGGEGTDLVTINGSSLLEAETFDIDERQVDVSDRLKVNLMTVERLSVVGGEGDDTFNLSSVSADAELSVEGREGDDTFNLGNADQSLDQIKGDVTIDGGEGIDTLNFDNQGVSNDTQGEITDDSVTGFGLGQGVTYQNIDNLSVLLGRGADDVTVTGTPTGQTTILTNDGNDQVTIDQIGGTTTVNTGVGADQATTSVPESPTGLTVEDPDADDSTNTGGTGDIGSDRTRRGRGDSTTDAGSTDNTGDTGSTGSDRTRRGRGDSVDTSSGTSTSTPVSTGGSRTRRGRS